MKTGIRGISRWAVAAGLVLALGPQSWAHAQVGRKISVGDYPSMKEGSPELVLVEVSDFQCPYCGQSARELLPRVDERFVRTGKVELDLSRSAPSDASACFQRGGGGGLRR